MIEVTLIAGNNNNSRGLTPTRRASAKENNVEEDLRR